MLPHQENWESGACDESTDSSRSLTAGRLRRSEKAAATTRHRTPSGGWSVDSVEVVEVLDRSLDRERLKRKAVVEAVDARLALETVQELARHLFSKRSVPIQELSPEGKMLKPTGDRARRGHIRDREQTAIRLEVVQPRRADHSQRGVRGSLDTLEEAGQLRHSPADAFDRQRRVPLRVGILEAQPDPLTTQRIGRKTPDGHHDGGPGHRNLSRNRDN